MIKVVHIHRQHRNGAYSIETLFHTISEELRNQGVMVIDYELGSRAHILSDLRSLRLIDADVFHITGDVNYLVGFLPRSKTVLTVHDIGHYLFGLKGWRRLVYKWLWLTLPMRLAKRVTVVSAATRDHIVKHFSISSERITVINNCYNPMFRPVPKMFNNTCPRILQVGSKPYKNVPRLIRALHGISCVLVVVGELDEAIREALCETGVVCENYIGLGQEALLQQYVVADLVAFVSIGEGFGVPIIEAQATGRSLITANIPPMSVVAGDRACLVDPTDVASIRAGIFKIIREETYRNQLVSDGLQNVEQYSPQTIAQNYLCLYHELINSKESN